MTPAHTPRPTPPLTRPAQLAFFAVALFLSLAAALFIHWRVQRVRAGLLRGGGERKVWYTTAFCTVTLNFFSFALQLAALLLAWANIPPLATWFRDLGLQTGLPCPYSIGLVTVGPASVCGAIGAGAALLALLLDLASHCMCKTHPDNHHWWELPKPPGWAASVAKDKAEKAALVAAAAAAAKDVVVVLPPKGLQELAEGGAAGEGGRQPANAANAVPVWEDDDLPGAAK